MNNDRLNDFDEEDRQLVLDFENTVLRGGMQFFDVDELEVIIDYYFEVNDMEPLQRAVEYAEQLYPDSTVVRLRRAHLLIAQQQFEAALKIIKELREKEPDSTDVAYSLGVAYGALGESQKAIDLFLEAAADGWMLGRVYSNIAEEYYNLRNYDNAIRYYQLALDTDTFDTSTIYNYYDTCVQAGQLQDAVEYFTSFLGEHPYSAPAWHCLGSAYYNLGLLERAVDAYQYALVIDKTAIDIYIDLATSQELLGNAGEAVTTLLRARDHTDHPASIDTAVAAIYSRANNHHTALLYLRRAAESDPGNPEVIAALAVAYIATDDKSSALSFIKKALRLAPNNPVVLANAAIIYDAIGNVQAASDYYERMVSCEDCSEDLCQRYTQFLYNHGQYDQLIDFALESLELYPAPSSPSFNMPHTFYSTYLVAACFYTNRYNRASRHLPYVDLEQLHAVCPEIFAHPRLSTLINDCQNNK